MARFRESEPEDDRAALVWATQKLLSMHRLRERFSDGPDEREPDEADAYLEASMAMLTVSERALVHRSVYDEDRNGPARDELERRFGPRPVEQR